MERITIIFAAILSANLIIIAQSDKCDMIIDLSGIIGNRLNAITEERCWIIAVPENYYIFLRLKFKREGNNGLEITEIKTNDKYIFDYHNYQITNIVFSSNVKILHYARNIDTNWWSEFNIAYEMDTFPVKGVKEASTSAISWLKQQRTPSWGWRENTPRAITALFLASAVNFNGTSLEEELMAKQMELRILENLLRSSLTSSELSILVNALLVTCRNPRNFFGKDLVKRLKLQVETTQNLTHPVAYLALCNANENWPSKALDDLHRVFGSDSEYLFVRDLQAIATMALSCIENGSISLTDGSSTSILYNSTIERFKSFQNEDGSFGNTHTSAWITQALLSRNQENNKDWNLTAAVDYLIRELKSSPVDFLFVYLTLPILTRNTLVDISKVDCSTNPRKIGDSIASENVNYLDTKIRVRYSLCIGDQKDVINTVSLTVSKNSTAYEVMKMAETKDSEFKFEEKIVSGKIYVYQMANTTNDPEMGKFWLHYISSTNNPTQLLKFFKNLDELIVNDGQHLVMWYKTVLI